MLDEPHAVAPPSKIIRPMTRATTRFIDASLRICVYEDGTAWSGSRPGRGPPPCPIRGLVLLHGWRAVASSVAVPDSVSTKVPKASPASAGRRRGTLGVVSCGLFGWPALRITPSCTPGGIAPGSRRRAPLPGSPQRKPPRHSVAWMGPARQQCSYFAASTSPALSEQSEHRPQGDRPTRGKGLDLGLLEMSRMHQ